MPGDGEKEALPDRNHGRWLRKTIGPTAAPFTHYWRIVAHLCDGKTKVFWGHATSAREAASKKALTEQAAKRYGWRSFDFEVAELTEH